MIAAWLSVTLGWVLARPVTLLIFGALTVLLVIALAVYLRLTAEPPGCRNASRPANPPRRAGLARAARRVLEAVRRAPGRITWTWRTPVRAVTKLPGRGRLSPAVRHGARPGQPSLQAGNRHPCAAPAGAPELHHERPLAAEDAATLLWLHWLRHDHPGWAVLAIRTRLATLGALITSGRAAPGHTAPGEHGEPGRPAGDMDPGAVATGSSDGPGPSIPETPTPVISAAPAFLAAAPASHDPALWQPTRLADRADVAPWARPLQDPSDTLTVRLDDFWVGA